MSPQEPRDSQASVITVELAIDDPELAERVHRMILQCSDLRVTESGGMRAADVMLADHLPAPPMDAAVIVFDDAADPAEMLLAGAAGLLRESIDREMLHAAIHSAAHGLTALSRDVRRQLLSGLRSSDGLADDTELEAAGDLTPRELQVLQLLCEGASNKMIARRLGITPHTAKFHVGSIVTKLGAAGRTDAVARAMRLGVILV